jgi:hypothetical protein
MANKYMFNILSHEGDANQNYTEIPFHPDWPPSRKQQMLVRM